MRFKASECDKKTELQPGCNRDDCPSHLLHLLQKNASTMREPFLTRPTERPTGRSLALLHRTARAHTTMRISTHASQRHCCPREKTKKPLWGGCARACTRTQSLPDGAEAGNRPYRRRGRADPVDADRGAVSHAQRAARKVRSRKRLIVVLQFTTSRFDMELVVD